jgi:N-acetylglucosaminyldiphosphoundecaprenol N-acetyl-beta-D-mannosaminyltransferase
LTTQLVEMNILGVRVDPLTVASLNEHAENLLESQSRNIVAYIHVHGVNLACRDAALARFFKNAAIVYCDGEGVRLGAKLLGLHIPERIALTDWVWEFFEICQRRSASLYFLGSTRDILEGAARRTKERFPGLKLLGYQQGYFEKRGPSNDAVINEINGLGPDVLLVGFGMPIQERWLMESGDRLQVKLILTVGSCFDYVSGRKRRCPRWMSQHGLEWLFRLMQEPRRLFKRYIIGNPLFVARVVWAAVSQGFKPRGEEK